MQSDIHEQRRDIAARAQSVLREYRSLSGVSDWAHNRESTRHPPRRPSTYWVLAFMNTEQHDQKMTKADDAGKTIRGVWTEMLIPVWQCDLQKKSGLGKQPPRGTHPPAPVAVSVQPAQSSLTGL